MEMHGENGLVPKSPPTRKKDYIYDSSICRRIARDYSKAAVFFSTTPKFDPALCAVRRWCAKERHAKGFTARALRGPCSLRLRSEIASCVLPHKEIRG